MERHQTSGTSSVQGKARALQVEGVGYPVRYESHSSSSEPIQWSIFRIAAQHPLVITAERGYVDSSVRAREFVKREASVFEGLVGYFEEKSLLRINRFRLQGAYVKESGIEEGQILFQKVQTLGIELRYSHSSLYVQYYHGYLRYIRYYCSPALDYKKRASGNDRQLLVPSHWLLSTTNPIASEACRNLLETGSPCPQRRLGSHFGSLA